MKRYEYTGTYKHFGDAKYKFAHIVANSWEAPHKSISIPVYTLSKAIKKTVLGEVSRKNVGDAVKKYCNLSECLFFISRWEG